MVELLPNSWPVYNMGYKYMVSTRPILVNASHDEIWNWLEAYFGGISMGEWIDQSDVICFSKKENALLFDMTWNSHAL